jgi:hypothetical protein
MTIETQNRPPLSGAVQQAAAATLASIVALQIATFLAADSLPAEKDYAICDASGGAFDLALPSSTEAIVGKPYIVKEVEGTNAVTLTTPGAETIDGSATFVVAAGTSACVVWDGTTWTSIANAGSGGAGFLADGAGTVDATNLATDSVTTVKIDDGAVTPVKENITPRVNPAGDNVVISATDRAVHFSSDGGGAATIDATAMLAGHAVWLVMTAFNTDSYTIAVQGGTLTFNAAGEAALLYKAGATLHALLAGATIV